MDHDHDRNHWFIHHPFCRHLTHNVHPYPHRGTARQYRLSDQNHLSLSHPSETDRRQLSMHRPFTQETSTSYSTRNLSSSFLSHTGFTNACAFTLQAPQEAHRPHLPVAEEIILLPHKGSSTNHKAPTFVSKSSRIPLVLVPFKESTYQSASLIHPLHHSAHTQNHSKFLFSWTIRERICSRGTR